MDEGRSIYSVLAEVQHRVSCPKGKENRFGGYKYRSLEDINAALKPVCEELKCGYFFRDKILPLVAQVFPPGEKDEVKGMDLVRWYLVAEVTFWAEGCKDVITTTAYAREAVTKKGMDDAQVTGMASSYARKYAVCGLFAIDSGEDPDQMDNREPSKRRTVKNDRPANDRPASADDVNALSEAMSKFAELRGKSTSEVLSALCSTKTLKAAGVMDGQKEWTEGQCKVAVQVIDSWIKKAEVQE